MLEHHERKKKVKEYASTATHTKFFILFYVKLIHCCSFEINYILTFKNAAESDYCYLNIHQTRYQKHWEKGVSFQSAFKTLLTLA